MPTFTILDSADLKRLARDLRDVADGRELRKELTQGLRGVLNPIRDQVKAAYRSAPSKGHASSSRARQRQPNLRTLLAGATRVEVRTSGRLAGARLRVDGRKMPSGMRSLPSMWEGPPQGKRWRHPVFPDAGPRHRFTDRTRTFATEAPWVQQESHPTFYRITAGHEVTARRAVEQVLDGVRRKLEAGT